MELLAIQVPKSVKSFCEFHSLKELQAERSRGLKSNGKCFYGEIEIKWIQVTSALLNFFPSKSVFIVLCVFAIQKAQSITCTYRDNENGYTCDLNHQLISDENGLQFVYGSHVNGKSNENVQVITAENSAIKIFPSLLIDKFSMLTTVDLTGVEMTSFVSPITSCARLVNVLLSKNLLTDIPEGIFMKCTNLDAIDFGENQIEEIHENAFAGLTNLRRLDLGDNRIKVLQTNVLKSTSNLIFLAVGVNEIEELQPELLASLPNLNSFLAFTNKINYLNESSFKNNRNLQEISLFSNQISKIDPETFTNLENLEILELDDNRLGEFPRLEGVISLKKLHLQVNMISEIVLNEDLESLEELDLGGNKLEKVKSDAFSYLTGLKTLSLKSNQISSLEAGAFSHLSLMKKLDLSNNSLVELKTDSFRNCTSLTTLNCQNNKIKKVESEIFDILVELETFDLTENICTTKKVIVNETIKEDSNLKDCFSFAAINRFNFVVLLISFMISLVNFSK